MIRHEQFCQYHGPYCRGSNIHVNNDIALIRLPRLANTLVEDKSFKVLPICLAWKPREFMP